MAKQSMQNRIKDDEKKSKKEEDQELSEELEMSFPASDPPSSTQPGAGSLGPSPRLPVERRRSQKHPDPRNRGAVAGRVVTRLETLSWSRSPLVVGASIYPPRLTQRS
jgi:hypothetical protein